MTVMLGVGSFKERRCQKHIQHKTVEEKKRKLNVHVKLELLQLLYVNLVMMCLVDHDNHKA